ncbi:unnamed protein product [marine sediment metagenome]|uniref:Uncharacterized protein n=1 Tax=marine sediment metagenome TaxID=412755 RepID=X1L7U2_9ZZZZ
MLKIRVITLAIADLIKDGKPRERISFMAENFTLNIDTFNLKMLPPKRI